MNNSIDTDTHRLAFNEIKKQLDTVSTQMVVLIQRYELDVQSPLQILSVAQKQITDTNDYVKFLELSLQGRLLSEAIEHLDNTK